VSLTGERSLAALADAIILLPGEAIDSAATAGSSQQIAIWTVGGYSLDRIADHLRAHTPQVICKQVTRFTPIVLVNEVRPKQIPGLVGSDSAVWTVLSGDLPKLKLAE
jgi:hypothetical protein